MGRFTVVMQEEQHWQIEAESEAALRERIEKAGPPSGWAERRSGDPNGPFLMENHDTVVSITADEPFTVRQGRDDDGTPWMRIDGNGVGVRLMIAPNGLSVDVDEQSETAAASIYINDGLLFRGPSGDGEPT